MIESIAPAEEETEDPADTETAASEKSSDNKVAELEKQIKDINANHKSKMDAMQKEIDTLKKRPKSAHTSVVKKNDAIDTEKNEEGKETSYNAKAKAVWDRRQKAEGKTE
jgi:acetyl-CoA carboxylase alpha subunit